MPSNHCKRASTTGELSDKVHRHCCLLLIVQKWIFWLLICNGLLQSILQSMVSFGLDRPHTIGLSLTLHDVIAGNFSGPKQQEIAAAKGNFLELLRPDDTGKVISICATPVFCIIRSMQPFRLAGKIDAEETANNAVLIGTMLLIFSTQVQIATWS